MKPFIYLRTLRRVNHTVFCVQDGQKYYRDPLFSNAPLQAYSSGQQVKRCIMDALTAGLDVAPAPTTFNWQVSDKKTGGEFLQKEAWSVCDPTFVDQLIGGYMQAAKEESVIKRRSPLSIGAMVPVHPLLGGIEKQKENLTFDRTSHPNVHPVVLRDTKNQPLSTSDAQKLTNEANRNLPNRIWIPDQTRVTGYFVNDVAIDLRTLFSVSTNRLEPELSIDMLNQLQNAGWVKSTNYFGDCLVLPKAKRDEYIPALADALLNWRITSNQSRTLSLMTPCVFAISDTPHHLDLAIRGQLVDDSEKPKATLILNRNTGSDVYVSPTIDSHIAGETGTESAFVDATNDLIERMSAYQYEKY